jgi:hypothetical protein
LILHGMKFNSYYSWDYPYILGCAYDTTGQYEQVLESLLNSLNRNEHAVNPRMFLAAAYVALRRKDDAQWEIDQIRVMSPETAISRLERNYPVSDQALMHRFIMPLREMDMQQD